MPFLSICDRVVLEAVLWFSGKIERRFGVPAVWVFMISSKIGGVAAIGIMSLREGPTLVEVALSVLAWWILTDGKRGGKVLYSVFGNLVALLHYLIDKSSVETQDADQPYCHFAWGGIMLSVVMAALYALMSVPFIQLAAASASVSFFFLALAVFASRKPRDKKKRKERVDSKLLDDLIDRCRECLPKPRVTVPST